MAKRKAGVLTVSDRCFKGEAEDTSGPNLIRLLVDWQELNISNVDVTSKCVPDQMEAIQVIMTSNLRESTIPPLGHIIEREGREVLIDWVDRRNLSLILTTGGTGFSPRDITPEATKLVLDKEAPGLVTAMISKSLEITPMAMLSRPVCGIRNNSLIVNLPGSKKGSEECFTILRPTLPHALDLLSGSHQRVHQTHQEMTGSKSHDIHMISHHSCSHGHVKTHTGTRTKEDFHPVALRPRHSPYPMLSVDEALHVISQNTPSHLLTEQKSLVDALQCVLAEDIIAGQPLPPFPASIKDGYAVISADGTGERDVLAPVAAGEMSSITVVSGSVARITTGAPLPNGADAVVMVEDTELIASTDDGKIEKKIKILSSVKPGKDIRPVGSDIAKGDIVLEKGSVLGPSEIGLAASVGVTLLTVYKTPRVAVLSTGNEVINPGKVLVPGQIYDSNRYSLLAAIKQYDFQGIDIGIAQDTREALVEQITLGLDKADVLITSGGVSMGEKDLLKPVLVKDFNATIHFGRVFMKPGKPTTFATVMRGSIQKLVFSLPGNPVSAAVTFHLFVLPALKKLAGHLNYQPTIVPAKISRPISLDPRPEYHRVTLVWHEQEPVPYVESTGIQQSSRLLSMKGADGLVVLPSKSDQLNELKSGEMVKVILFKN